MRLTFFVVWKSWGSNKIRTLLTILGVALGIAVVTAIHVLDHNTIHSRLQQRIADYGRVDLELLPKDSSRSPGHVREQLSSMQDFVASVGLLHGGELGAVALAAPVAKGTAQQQNPTGVVLYGLSPLPSQAFAHYNVAKGEDLIDLEGDKFVLIGAQLATTLGVDVDDELFLAPPPRARVNRCIDGKMVTSTNSATKGEMVSVKIKGILSHHALGRANNGAVVVGSFSLGRRVRPHAPSFYQINRVEGTSPDVLKQRLAADFQVLDKRSAMLGEGSDERAFRNGIKMIGLLALVLGMLVVFQTLSQTLMERLKQIGLMRCLGASRRAVASIFLVEGILLALVGAVVGVLGGIGLAYVMGRLELTTLGIGKEITGFEVPPRPVLFAAGLGVFFTLAGSAFPLWKARNVPPVRVLQSRGLGDSGYLLRGVNIFLFMLLVIVLPFAYLAMTPLLTEGGRETRNVLLQAGGIVVLFGGVLLISPHIVRAGGRAFLRPLKRRLPLSTFMVDKTIARNPGRFSAAVCGLAVVLVALVALKHITFALRAEVRQFSVHTMDNHVFFKGEPRQLEDVKMVQSIDGVVSAEFFGDDVRLSFLLRGLPVDDLIREGGALAGKQELIDAYRDTRSLIVSQRWAELNWKKETDDLKILTDSGGKDYQVISVDNSAGFFPDEKAWAVTSPRWLQQDFCKNPTEVTRIALQLKPGTDAQLVRQQVTELFPHTWFKRGDDIRNYLLRDVTKDFLLFDLLLFLILILVGVGLVNTMTIAAVGRAREIGVLRALGMEDRSLRQTFLVEGAMVAMLAAIVAIAMGLPLGYIVVNGLNRVTGLEAPVVIPWSYVALVPVLALITGLFAAILPGSRAIKMNPAEAVRYE
jgi:ABC-type lipoprotein release transport system permease subunit